MSELMECVECNQSFSVPDDYETPVHGLCWPCSSEAVTRYKAALERIERTKGGMLLRTSHETSTVMWFIAHDALHEAKDL